MSQDLALPCPNNICQFLRLEYLECCDTLEDWDYSVSYTVDTLIPSTIINALSVENSKVFATTMYNGKSFTLAKAPIGLNGTYTGKTSEGLKLKVLLTESNNIVEFMVVDQSGSTVSGGYAKYNYVYNAKDDRYDLYTELDEFGEPKIIKPDNISISTDWYGKPSSATFKTAGGKVVKASLDEIYNGKTSIYLGADTNSYTLEVTMSQATNIVEFKLLIGGKTAENGKVEFEFEVTDSGEVKLYRKGQRDDD